MARLCLLLMTPMRDFIVVFILSRFTSVSAQICWMIYTSFDKVESVSCLCVMKSYFSHCSICEIFLWVCAMRGADTRCTEKLPKTVLHQVTSAGWLQNESFRDNGSDGDCRIWMCWTNQGQKINRCKGKMRFGPKPDRKDADFRPLAALKKNCHVFACLFTVARPHTIVRSLSSSSTVLR